MGRYKPGESGNPAGRPKGAKNRTPEALRAFVQGFLFDRTADIEKAWKQLDDGQKLMYFDRLCKLILPPPVDPVLRLSDQDFDRLVNQLKNKTQ